MRGKLLLLLSLLSATVVAYADNLQSVSQNTAVSAVTYTEDKTNISLIASQAVFTIQLKSNPSTGYSWFLGDYDAALLTPIRHTYSQALNGSPGSGSYELWTFQAAPGAFIVPRFTTIRFNYIRPWAVNDAPKVEVFNITTKQHIPE